MAVFHVQQRRPMRVAFTAIKKESHDISSLRMVEYQQSWVSLRIGPNGNNYGLVCTKGRPLWFGYIWNDVSHTR